MSNRIGLDVMGGDHGPEITIAGSGYHLYSLVFDPVAGSADLIVDGDETWAEFDVVRLFEDEREARAYASAAGIDDVAL